MTTLISNGTDIELSYRSDNSNQKGIIPAYGFTELHNLQLGDKIIFENKPLGYIGKCTINSTSNSKYLARFNIELPLAEIPPEATKFKIAQRQNREEVVYLVKLDSNFTKLDSNFTKLDQLNNAPLALKLRKNISTHLPDELMGKINSYIPPSLPVFTHKAGISDKTEKPKSIELLAISGIVLVFFFIFIAIIGYLLYNRKMTGGIVESPDTPRGLIDPEIYI